MTKIRGLSIAALNILMYATPAFALDCAKLTDAPSHGFCTVPHAWQGLDLKQTIQGNKSNSAAVVTTPTTPAQKAWNAEADKVLAYENLMNKQAWSGANLTLVYSSRTLMSGLINIANGAPNLRVNWSAKAINLHVPSGEPYMLSEMLMPDALEHLAARCMAQAPEGTAFKEHERELVKGRLLSMQSWSIDDKGAKILLPPFSLGGVSQPIYGCTFTAAELKPYVLPSFGLWH